MQKPRIYSGAFAVWTGLEPATPCVTGRYSNQLNYQTKQKRTLRAVWTGLEPATPCVTGRYSNQLNYQTKVLSGSSFCEICFPKSCANIPLVLLICNAPPIKIFSLPMGERTR